MICSHCGEVVTSEGCFCPHCGVELELTSENKEKLANEVPTQGERTDVETVSVSLPSKKTMGKILCLLGIILILAVLIILLNPQYRYCVSEYKDCVETQQSLSGYSAQSLYGTYDSIISHWSNRIRAYRTAAVICGVLALASFIASAVLGTFFSVQSWINQHIKLENVSRKTVLGIGAVVLAGILILIIFVYHRNANELRNAFEAAGGENFCGEWATVSRDGSYLTIDTNPADVDDFYDGDALTVIRKINSALGLPDSLIEKMMSTRAMDGRQSASYGNIAITWTYHPNEGLEIMYERE